jgi:Leucine-rich repeat (LRR) protein
VVVIPNAILGLSNLRTLDIADNFIERIPEEIDRLKELRLFILWDNPISYYPNSLGLLENLEILDLLNNQMNIDTQTRLTNILPKTRIIMSAPCRCEDGEN